MTAKLFRNTRRVVPLLILPGLVLVVAAGVGQGAAVASGVASAPGAAHDTLTVVTLNLWHDQRDWPRRQARIVRELRALQPDVVCLQEVLQHATLANQAATMAESLGYRMHFTSVDAEGAPKRYGNAILTPHAILRRGGKFLDPRNDYRTVAHVRIDLHGRPFDVYDTHLHHTTEGGVIRAEQIADLLAFMDSTRGDGADPDGGAVILAGDFNAELGSPELAPVEKRFASAFAVLHPEVRGPAAATLNAALGHQPVGIDHIFVPRAEGARLRPVEAEILFRDPGPDSVWASDHFGVRARLVRDQPRPRPATPR